MTEKKKVLFVCLGNICRSPIAKGVFQKTVIDMNIDDQWEIESAAIIDRYDGKRPNRRAIDIMKKYHVPYSNRARQITLEDFNNFDYIFGMDEKNIQDLIEKAPKDSKAKLLLFGDFDPQGDRIMRDPYFDSGMNGFEKCYQQAVRCSKGFLERLENGDVK